MRRLASPLMVVLLALLVVCTTAVVDATQDFRGAIVGRITDASGARLPGATVTATNVATNVGSTATTDNDGGYSILYLQPGTYKLTIELSGFKKLVRDGIEVRVGDRLTVDLGMEVGGVEETVSVRAEAPLLELGSASAGQVIDEKRIALMPLSDGNPFVLSRFVPGVAYTGPRSPPTGRLAATSSPSMVRRTWQMDDVSPSCRQQGPSRSSRSKRQASTRLMATLPARTSTSR